MAVMAFSSNADAKQFIQLISLSNAVHQERLLAAQLPTENNQLRVLTFRWAIKQAWQPFADTRALSLGRHWRLTANKG